ncbi:hypothetical protein Q5P01_007091 [Channa striata]|uniref:Uncharacterized protein n=1 Tax=Channa striata TaxID=64152 RepID=A0AA88N2V7_CHASR|nr:hypothetical protein Q5P01_007091 [Channa striata]
MAGNSPWNSSHLLEPQVFIIGCFVVLLAVFPVAQITIGALYMHECPVAPAVPVYVVVWGTLTLLLMALFGLSKLLGPAAPYKTLWKASMCSLVLFHIAWLIYGSYHVYSIYPPNYDKNLNDTNRLNIDIHSTSPPPDHRLGLSPENQNHTQSLQDPNSTSLIHSNQTLMEIIQTLALSNVSSETSGEALNAPRVAAAVAYCHKTVYLFAFWTTTMVYVFTINALASINCFR